MRIFQARSVGNICSSVRVTAAKEKDESPSYCVTTQKAYMTFWQVWLSSVPKESSPQQALDKVTICWAFAFSQRGSCYLHH